MANEIFVANANPTTQGEHCSKEEPRAGDHLSGGAGLILDLRVGTKTWNKQGDIWQGIWYTPWKDIWFVVCMKMIRRCRMTWWQELPSFLYNSYILGPSPPPKQGNCSNLARERNWYQIRISNIMFTWKSSGDTSVLCAAFCGKGLNTALYNRV